MDCSFTHTLLFYIKHYLGDVPASNSTWASSVTLLQHASVGLNVFSFAFFSLQFSVFAAHCFSTSNQWLQKLFISLASKQTQLDHRFPFNRVARFQIKTWLVRCGNPSGSVQHELKPSLFLFLNLPNRLT